MKQWIKTKILDWLTTPTETKEVEVKYNDAVGPNHISQAELTDVVFNEEVVMFVVGKREGKWLYYARPKYKHEKRSH